VARRVAAAEGFMAFGPRFLYLLGQALQWARYGLATLYGLDQPAKSVDMLRSVLDSQALDDDAMHDVARLEARQRLLLGKWERACELLEPRVEAFERRYLGAVDSADIDETGDEYFEIPQTLAWAQALVALFKAGDVAWEQIYDEIREATVAGAGHLRDCAATREVRSNAGSTTRTIARCGPSARTRKSSRISGPPAP